MGYRRTLRREVACTGIGLHCGRPVRLRLVPAPAEHGIRFVRTDVGVEMSATLQQCLDTGVPAGFYGDGLLTSPAGQYTFLQGGEPVVLGAGKPLFDRRLRLRDAAQR